VYSPASSSAKPVGLGNRPDLTWAGRYNKPEQYENIILKANPDGEVLRLKDVAKIGLGSSFYSVGVGAGTIENFV
jgi:multidrug efflux pump subunit AcrB